MTVFSFHPSTGFVSCFVDSEMAAAALKNIDQRSVTNSRTFSSENGNSYVGSLGEEAILRYFGDKYKPHNNLNFDGLLQGKDGKFYKVDIKTKTTSNPPNLSFEQSVPVYSAKQQTPDFYFFVNAIKSKTFNGEYSQVYIVGFMASDRIKAASLCPDLENKNNEIYLRKKGSMIDAGRNSRTAKSDDWVFKISALSKLSGMGG